MSDSNAQGHFKNILDLIKLRITVMQWVTFAMGFWLGNIGQFDLITFVYGLIGTGLVASGAGAINHAMEKDIDRLMNRTKNRPLPTGVYSTSAVVGLSFLLLGIGSSILFFKVNLLTAVLAVLTYGFYVIYTVSKKYTSLNTLIGAIPGAMAPLGGWAASSGTLNLDAWVFFIILFVWQLPHFYAIAWMFKDDYESAKLKMISCFDVDGSRTYRQILITIVLLIVVSVYPYFTGMLGSIYLFGSICLGCFFLINGLKFNKDRSILRARKIMRVSIIYLPLLLLVMIIDIQLMI
ncbi:protoheme IX farnesyltransferase [bacterium]|jgi:heme o synthase|nr:protoheme IX farnesyltransferase [bacterium]